jgi:hypothetical protein
VTPAWLEANLGAARWAELRSMRGGVQAIELPARTKSGRPLVLIRSGRSMDLVATAPGFSHVHTHVQIFDFSGAEFPCPTVDLVCHPCNLAKRITYDESAQADNRLEDEWKRFIAAHVDCERGSQWESLCTPGYAIIEKIDLRMPD